MFTSGCRPWLKNVARLSSVLMEENEEATVAEQIFFQELGALSYESLLLFHQSDLADEYNIENHQH